jgi:hypothetical protein
MVNESDFDADREEDLVQWEAEHRDDPYEGDARVCPRHPHVKTSSPDGMFDGPCYVCEAGMYEDELADEERRVNEAIAEMATPEWQAEKMRRDTFAIDTHVTDEIPF